MSETKNTDLENARRILHEENLTCVLCRGETVYRSDARGIAPMMHFLDEGCDMTHFSAADTIIGRAAAMLFVLAGVDAVHGDVMSAGARDMLLSHGIRASWGTLSEQIVNRRGDGICPMEAATAAITDPARARLAIRETMRRLADEKKKKKL